MWKGSRPPETGLRGSEGTPTVKTGFYSKWFILGRGLSRSIVLQPLGSWVLGWGVGALELGTFLKGLEAEQEQED